MELNEETIRATAIAHTINLGKCPAVGTPISFSFQIQTLDTATMKTKDATEKRRVGFVVEQKDIDAARALIAAEKASYVPKVTAVPLTDGILKVTRR